MAGNPSGSYATGHTYGRLVTERDISEHDTIVGLACRAISTTDLDTLVSRVFAPSVTWHEPGRNVLSGDYEGCTEVVLHLVARLAELTGGTFRLDLCNSMARGTTGVGLMTATASRHGRVLMSRDVLVATVRRGRIEEAWSYHHDQHAWDQFWS